MTDAEREWRKKKPRAIDIAQNFALWVMGPPPGLPRSSRRDEVDDLVAIDTCNTPYLTADQAERAGRWLLRYAEWKSGLDLIRSQKPKNERTSP